ncbi:unnamed protein product [Ectocarpus sp. 13 AM-2016]
MIDCVIDEDVRRLYPLIEEVLASNQTLTRATFPTLPPKATKNKQLPFVLSLALPYAIYKHTVQFQQIKNSPMLTHGKTGALKCIPSLLSFVPWKTAGTQGPPLACMCAHTSTRQLTTHCEQ